MVAVLPEAPYWHTFACPAQHAVFATQSEKKVGGLGRKRWDRLIVADGPGMVSCARAAIFYGTG